MNCPKCKNKLKHGKTKENAAEIDYCPKCKGIWFDKAELGQVIRSAIKDIEITSDAQKHSILCPKCFKPLYVFDYPQTLVKIDMCKKCDGIWLDVGELKEIDMVRKALSKSGQAKEYADPTGIKGALIRFVDSSLERLQQWH